jgi:hypothetical protein
MSHNDPVCIIETTNATPHPQIMVQFYFILIIRLRDFKSHWLSKKIPVWKIKAIVAWGEETIRPNDTS